MYRRTALRPRVGSDRLLPALIIDCAPGAAAGRDDVPVDVALVAYLRSDGAVGRHVGFHPADCKLLNRLLGCIDVGAIVYGGENLPKFCLGVLFGTFDRRADPG